MARAARCAGMYTAAACLALAGCSKSALPGDAGVRDAGGRDGAAKDAGTDGGAPALRWYLTCGYPVCGGPGQADAATGAPRCTTQQAGDSCTHASETCDPGTGCGENLLCTDHDPRMQPGGCPISRARFKRDIEYLSPDELQRYADQLLALPLATYRYKDDLRARKHLGFVLEDVEPSAPLCVDAARDRVDLYGYTSMAVAALKRQQQQIEELRRELHAVQRRLRVLQPRQATGSR